MALLRSQDIAIDNPRYIATTAWTTDELMDAIDAEKPKGPFELVTLLIGVNDQYRARPLSSFASGFAPVLAKAIALAGKKVARVVVVSIPDWGATPYAKGRDSAAISKDIDAYNGHARAAALKSGCAWVDVTEVSRKMAANPSLAVSDGLHPSGAMYREWADLIAPAAKAALG